MPPERSFFQLVEGFTETNGLQKKTLVQFRCFIILNKIWISPKGALEVLFSIIKICLSYDEFFEHTCCRSERNRQHRNNNVIPEYRLCRSVVLCCSHNWNNYFNHYWNHYFNSGYNIAPYSSCVVQELSPMNKLTLKWSLLLQHCC